MRIHPDGRADYVGDGFAESSQIPQPHPPVVTAGHDPLLIDDRSLGTASDLEPGVMSR
jgi:hypothetical protein